MLRRDACATAPGVRHLPATPERKHCEPKARRPYQTPAITGNISTHKLRVPWSTVERREAGL